MVELGYKPEQSIFIDSALNQYPICLSVIVMRADIPYYVLGIVLRVNSIIFPFYR